MKYNKCGEILVAPSIDLKYQYILKCSECEEIYSVLDSFLSHCLGHVRSADLSKSRNKDNNLNESQGLDVAGVTDVECEEPPLIKDEFLSDEEDYMFQSNVEGLECAGEGYKTTENISMYKGHKRVADINPDEGSRFTENIDSHDEKYIHSSDSNYGTHTSKKQKYFDFSDPDYTIDQKLLILQGEVSEIKDLTIQKQQIDEARHNMILQTLANQNVTISNILVKQNKHLKSISASHFKTTQFVDTFPINTDEDLIECESLINEDNKQEMITTVRSLLGGRGIVKGLTSIISQDLLIDYNYQGIHNKKPLKNFKKLMSVIEMASFNPKEPAIFQDNIRKAIKGAKNRHFKDASVKRSKDRNQSELILNSPI